MGSNLSLRSKLLFLVLAVVLCFGGAISFYLMTRVSDKVSSELLKRGESIARHLSVISTEAFIEHDTLRLQYLAREHQATEADIRYVMMIDREGDLLAHSFGTTFPTELADVNRYVSGQKAVIKRLDTGGEVVYDIAVPVLDGRIGSLRVGISTESVRAVVATLMGEILFTIVLIGFLSFALTLPLARAISRPLASLTRAIEELSAGRRDLQLPSDRRDEIGVLNDAFNQMSIDVREAEKRLAAQVHFLQVLMKELPIPVFYKNIEGRVLGCNSAFAEFWGKPVEVIIGLSAAELYPPEDAGLHQAKDAEALHAGHPVVYEYAVTGADGARHCIVFHKVLYRGNDDQPAGTIGVMHDVTMQREADRVKSEFVSTVAHEFQTPLATILGFCELLSDEILGEEESKDALWQISRKAEALSQMVDELLDLARLENGHPLSINRESCNLNRLLTESVDGFRKRMATHQFTLELPMMPLMIEIDPKRIGQVMENLLSNAVKYSRMTTTISVSALSRGELCQIVVRDEGVGMSADQLKHLFDKFYRANPSKSSPAGTGLGLFITKSIVEAHQGTVHIDSVLGQGTTVTVSLPVGHNAQETLKT